MGRPKKMENGRSRSFLLPTDLLEQLEVAATIRDRDVSDVVREILEAHIGAYRDQSIQIRRERLQQAVEAVQGDPVLSPIFERQRSKKNLVLPLGTGLKKAQMMLLVEALEADRELRNQDVRTDTVVDPLLHEAVQGFPERYHRLFLDLHPLLSGKVGGLDGELKLEKDGKVLRFSVGGKMEEMLRNKARDEPTVESFRELIHERCLVKDGSRNGRVLYRVSGSKHY
jgi:hypothetical protein